MPHRRRSDGALDVEHLADLVRDALQAAGVERPALFKRTKNRLRFRAHDLRGTFVTLALANGKTETWVADRTGHKSSQMIARYRQAAREASELDLGWLAPLDTAIRELLTDKVSGIVNGEGSTRSGATSAAPKSASDVDDLCTRRDLNSHGFTRRNLNRRGRLRTNVNRIDPSRYERGLEPSWRRSGQFPTLFRRYFGSWTERGSARRATRARPSLVTVLPSQLPLQVLCDDADRDDDPVPFFGARHG